MSQRWEYKIEWLKEFSTDDLRVLTAEDQAKTLDSLGLHGWEAFAVVGLRVFMKRLLPPTKKELALAAEQNRHGD